MIIEPTLEHYIYYLRRIENDDGITMQNHRAVFAEELQSLLAHLECLSNQTIPPWKWPEESLDRHASQCIMRTDWLDNSKTDGACFVEARTYGDVYWLQIGYYQPGAHHPRIFADLRDAAWCPTIGDHLLGHSSFLCGVVIDDVDELASQALAAYIDEIPKKIVSTHLADLCACFYGSHQSPYVTALFYPDALCEEKIGQTVLNNTALRFELYHHKIQHQLAWAEEGLKLLTEQKQKLYKFLSEAEPSLLLDSQRLQQLLQLSRAFDLNISTLAECQMAIDINLDNLAIALEEIQSSQDEYLGAIHRRLRRRHKQLGVDLESANQMHQRTDKAINHLKTKLELANLMASRTHENVFPVIERGEWVSVRPPIESEMVLHTYVTLQIRLSKAPPESQTYASEALLSDGAHFTGGTLNLDTAALTAAQSDPQQYGKVLHAALFTGPIRDAYLYAAAQSDGYVRVQLWIDSSATDLQHLIWERVLYQQQNALLPMATSAKQPFSRYFSLEQADVQPITTRPLRMLVAFSNPVDLAQYNLASLDVAAEFENLAAALSDFQQTRQLDVTFLLGKNSVTPTVRTQWEQAGCRFYDGPVNLDTLLRALTEGSGYHILHLLAHGSFNRLRQEAALYLEDQNGHCEIVKDSAFAIRIAGIAPSPSLIFLAACESAKRDAESVNPFMGLGPRLVQRGVPAVVAMQDTIPLLMARKLTYAFYRYLFQHGNVDQAMNQARLLLWEEGSRDWATPALFTRLKEGRLFCQL